MKIVFVSVALNIHQVGVADELYRLTDGQYWFVETDAPAGDSNKGGTTDFTKRPYLLRPYLNETKYRKAMEVVREADVMVYGPSNFVFFKERIRTQKLTFLYSERWFKRGWVNIFSPRLVKQMLFYHTHCHGKPVYLLSSGGYAADDFHQMFAFRGKSFKWGYFTAVPDLDIASILRAKRGASTLKILWVARFLKWKHPERMLQLAMQLQQHGLDDFVIDMIGVGPEYDGIARQIADKGLTNHVRMLGSMPNDKVIDAMRSHHIFCFTSDRYEGWGAVVNESMGSGCCPVITKDCGAAPYLIDEGQNGFTFDLAKPNDLYEKVMWLIEHPEERERMSVEAYRTIHDVWSPRNAAARFFQLCDAMLAGYAYAFAEGPCAKA